MATAQAAHIGPADRQVSLQAAIDQSPRVLAQRRAIQASFGSALQLRAEGLEDGERYGAWPVQCNSEGATLNDSLAASADAAVAPVNDTGMPDHLKAGIEALSGMDMSGVRVHRNSDKPAQLNALAYAQGNDIHLGPGQEQHLPHEAWHVVQQKRGRVRGRIQLKGKSINDDPQLEHEADVMGRLALSNATTAPLGTLPPQQTQSHVSCGVAQLARILDAEDGRYVLIDVPGDGSCLLHAVNLAEVIAENSLLGQLTDEPPALSPQEIEDAVLEAFEDEFENEAHDSLREAYDIANATLRANIVAYLNAALETGDDAVLQGLKQDIQTIYLQTLSSMGLMRGSASSRQPVDEPGVDKADLDMEGDFNSKSGPSSTSTDMADEDFIMIGLYEPQLLRSLLSTKDGRALRESDALDAVIPTADLTKCVVAMGVHPSDDLAGSVRYQLRKLADAGHDARNVPLGSLDLPPATSIPDYLCEEYVEEFRWNTSLWAGEAMVEAAAAVTRRNIVTHVYGEDYATGEVELVQTLTSEAPLPSLKDGRINIYNAGSQTHFQVMIGPFPEGYFDEEAGLSSSTPVSENDGLASSSSKEGPASSSTFGSILDESSGSQSNVDDGMSELLRSVADELDEPVSVAFAQELYRAAVSENLSLDRSSVEELADCLQEWRMAGSRQLGAQRRPRLEIVPLAGIIQDLVALGLPPSEVERLREAASRYVAFHRERSTWKKKHAGVRVKALKDIAALLDRWAEDYDAEAIRRGPSVAEFTTRRVQGADIGERMRAVLTIDPGTLVGYEPEDYAAWNELSGQMGGFVRAHLLNKHLGGPGHPSNLGFLSSKDNTLMSDLVEERVKRAVIEDNQRVFYKVAMPLGRGEHVASSSISLDPRLAGRLPHCVELSADSLETVPGNDDFESTNMLAAVELPEGVEHEHRHLLRFTAALPDAGHGSKLTGNQGKRIATARSDASNLSMETMQAPSVVRSELTRLQQQLLRAPTDADRTQVLKDARTSLARLGLDADEVEAHLVSLSRVAIKQGAVRGSQARDKEKADNRRAGRAGKLLPLGVTLATLTPKQQAAILKLGDVRWAHLLAALGKGVPLKSALWMVMQHNFVVQLNEFTTSGRL